MKLVGTVIKQVRRWNQSAYPRWILARRRSRQVNLPFTRHLALFSSLLSVPFIGGASSQDEVHTSCPTPDRALHMIGPNEALAIPIRGGQCHQFVLDYDGKPLVVQVDQHAVDVVLAVEIHEFRFGIDTPGGQKSDEMAFIDGEPGRALLEVRSKGNEHVSGRYQLRIVPLDQNDPRLGQKILAHRESQRARTTSIDTARSNDSVPQLAEAYRSAASAWLRAGDSVEAARMYLYQGWVEQELGDYPRAVATFKQAQETLDKSSDTYLGLRITLERALTEIHIPEYAEADRSLRAAIDSSDAAVYPALYAHLHIALGLSYHYQGRLDEARGLYSQALAILHDGVDADLQAMAINNLAGVSYELGDFVPALEFYERALAAYQITGNEAENTHALMNRAYLHMNAGTFDQALIDFDRSLDAFERLGMKADVAFAMHGLGLSYLGLGAYAKAERWLKSSLAVNASGHGNARDTIRTQLYLGDVYRHQGEIEEAISMHSAALAKSEEMADPFRGAVATAALGADYIAAEQHGTALALLKRAQAQFRKLGHRRQLADTLQLLAAAQQEAATAEVAIQTLTDVLPLHLSTENRRGAISALVALAALQLEAGDLDKALNSATQAADYLESARANISQADLRASYFGASADPYARLVDILMAKHGEDPEAGHDVQAFLAAERSRARSLKDVLARASVDPFASAPAKLRKKRDSLHLQLNGKLFRLRTLQERLESIDPTAADHVSDRGALVAQAHSTESDILRILSRLDSNEAEIAKVNAAVITPARVDHLELRRIQQSLDQETLIFSYFLSEPNSYLWMVTGPDLKSTLLPGRSSIEPLVRDAYMSVSTVAHSEPTEVEALSRIAKAILPDDDSWHSYRNLIVVPDGALGYVPFSALPLASGDNELNDANLIIDRLVLSYTPSATLLTRVFAPKPFAAGSVIVFADPLTSIADEVSPAQIVSRTRGSLSSNRELFEGIAAHSFAPLPYSRYEAEQIRELLPPGTVRVALGADANARVLSETYVETLKIVHFATHGVVIDELPELSGLVLSRLDVIDQSDDGFLSLQEIYGLRLNADLVVLSACRTALGQDLRGEGFLSLSRGFLAAGARQTIASSWAVSDLTTAELMRTVYFAMYHEDATPAEALRSAQQNVRAHRKWRSPYFWAGFAVVGAAPVQRSHGQ